MEAELASLRNKFFSFVADSFSEGRRSILKELAPLEVYPFPLEPFSPSDIAGGQT